MDWNTLPDLLALTALVVVFSTLVPRNADGSLRLWLGAWALIVVHFGAKFFDASGENVGLELITDGTLVLAGSAFMWAAVSTSIARREAIIFASLAIPQLAYVTLADFSVNSLVAYVATVFAGFALPTAALMRFVRDRRDRVMAVLCCALLSASLLLVIRYDSDPSDGVTNILTWLYLGAGLLHWRRFRRPTAGALTVVGGFIFWGLVFPVGAALAAWLPHLHIDDTAYNIPKYIVAIGIILTLLEEQMERSVFLAQHDALTGLPNRRKLEDRIDCALDRARRSAQKVALLTIDLDRFKSINDSYGHHAGDEFLCEVARRFNERVRRVDMCARQGGDEFIVVAEQLTCRADAESIANALLATLDTPVDLHGERIFAGASIGIALYPDDGTDAETLRAVSDASMYVTKRLQRRRESLVEPARAAAAG